MSVPALGCSVCAIEAGSCSEAAGAQRCPGQLPPAPCGPSPRASEVQLGDTARMPAWARECPGTPRPHHVAGRALPSPVEIKHRMGMEREGVWQQPVASSGRGLAEGSSCTCPGFLHVQLLPLTRAYIQQRCESGVPAAGSSEAPAVPMLGGGSKQQPAAPATCRATPRPGAGGKGARVTLPCLENMNLHVKVGVGPCPGCQVPRLWRQDHGAVQNGSREGAGARSSWCGASLGTRSGGRQQVGSPGDVEIC